MQRPDHHNKMRMFCIFKFCAFSLLSLFLAAGRLFAAGNEGVSGAQFLRISAGAKASALGETGAVSAGAQSLFYNPAGLADVSGSEFSVSYIKWIMETGYSNLALAQKVSGGVLGLGLSYFYVPPTAQYNKFGAELADEYVVRDMAVILGYSLELGPGANLGLGLKRISSKLDTNTASATAGDAGIKYAVIPDALTLGFAAQNIGTKLKFNEVADSLPFNLKLGGQYLFRFDADTNIRKDVSLFADINSMKDAGVYANFGLDCTMLYDGKIAYSIRGGYKTTAGAKGSGATLGLGLDSGTYLIDYAFSPMGDLGKVHRGSFTFRFGGKPAPKRNF